MQNTGANVLTPTLANIQKLNFNTTTAAVPTLNLSGLSTLTALNIEADLGGAVNVNNLGSLPSIALTGTGAASTLNFTEAALAPAGQTLNLTLSGVTGGGLTLSDTGNNALETVKITSSNSANTLGGLTTSGLGVTTLQIHGSQNIAVGALTDANGTLRTVDASAATGNVTLTTLAGVAGSTVTGGAGNDTITTGGAGADSFVGGAGDDTFVMGANLSMDDTIDGGTGTNVLSTTVGAANLYTTVQSPREITNIQTLTITDAAAAATFNANTIDSSINAVRFDAGTFAGASAITGNAGAFSVRVGNANAVTLGAALTVTDTGTATTDSLTVTSNGTGNALNGQALTSTGYETLTVNTNNNTVAGAQTLGAVTVTPDVGGTATFNITGSNQLTTGVITATNGTINASGMTLVGSTANGLTMIAGANTATSIVGSGGVDTIFGDNVTNRNTTVDAGDGADVITTYGGNDSILGGAGNDVITTATGSDYIDGGAGNDRVVFASGQLTAGDTVIGGDGTDILSYTTFVTATDNLVAAQSRVSGFETLRLAASAAAPAANAVTMSNYINNTGFTTVQLDLTAAANTNGFAFTNVGTGTNTLNLITADGATTSGTHTWTRLADTATDTLTIANTLTAAAPGATTLTALTAANENTVNLNSGVAGDTLTITTLTTAQLGSLNIAGAGATVVTSLVAPLLTTLDASTSTGAVSVGSFANTTATTVTSGTGALTYFAGTGADVITGNASNDVIYGNLGADTINVGGGTNTLYYSAAQAGAGSLDTALYVAPVANSISTVGMDVVSGMNTGDIINLNASAAVGLTLTATGYTGAAGAALGLIANGVVANNLAGLTGIDNAITLVRGTYTGGSTNTFVGGAAGADTLVIYDSNATVAASSFNALVLVGYVDTSGVGIGGAAGVVTLL